jgi:murein DD-endopeptidase MepM/ murein hydrolase activator NlpD
VKYGYRHYKTNRVKRHNQDVLLRYLIHFILCFIILFYISYIENKIALHMITVNVKKEGIDYDAFRQMKVNEKYIKKTKNILNKETNMTGTKQKKYNGLDYFTIRMMISGFDMSEYERISKRNLNKLLDALHNNDSFLELKGYYSSIIYDISYFPIPFKADGSAYVTYNDSWNSYRSYGGNRRHEGTDLMPEENIPGVYLVRSITKGTVEKKGWLEQGGYRIGIRSTNGGYYYYAHLDSYAEGLDIGDSVEVGQVLGFMGDSGYGEEGTRGEFLVHLHLGIYVDSPFGETSVNPYWILKYLERNNDME